ncbi:MAG: hypothetical protein HZB43_10855 [candidate division Zixibacteria bacterium]|nr:hypothetical protein [candidate division Zixibacteria bacterium]
MLWHPSYLRTVPVGVLLSVLVAGFGVALAPASLHGSNATPFERSVQRGTLDPKSQDYYAAVWTVLGFFRRPDSVRALLAPYSVSDQRPKADSVINMLFLPLDSDPIAPGNSLLLGLEEKLEYCESRGFLHPGGGFLSSRFDDIGRLILLNGLPELAFTSMQLPELCGYLPVPRMIPPDSVPTYHISWTGEEYVYQEDCWGYWRLLTTEFPRGGGTTTQDRNTIPLPGRRNRLAARPFAMQKFNEQFVAGVAAFDLDEPLSDQSVTARPVAILDTSDWRSMWTVINLGLRETDFVRDSNGWNRMQVTGALTVSAGGSDNVLLLDSVVISLDLGLEKPGHDDLVALQKVGRVEVSRATRECVAGIDLASPKNQHWKKSIPFPVGWTDDSLTVGYGWLLNPRVLNERCLGGRPPLVHDVIARGDTMMLFFQLMGAQPDIYGEFRTHVRLRFIREEEYRREVVLSKLYKLGTEPLGKSHSSDPLCAATVLGIISTDKANANVTFSAEVPLLKEGLYKIVVECHRTTGTDPLPFEMVILDNVRILGRANQASP